MTPVHEFDGSKAQIYIKNGNFVAQCRCGWVSARADTKEEAVIEFEEHVQSDPAHRIGVEYKERDYWTLLMAIFSLAYVFSPIDLVPNALIGLNWLDDLLFLILAVIFLRGGWKGKSPWESFGDLF